MKLLRIKVVSQCIGIRRSDVLYVDNFNQTLDVSNYDHPFNKLKNITINNDKLIILDNIYNIDDNIIFNLKVNSLGKEIEEVYHVTSSIVEINDNDLDLLKKHFNTVFDEYKGEYEYLYAYYLYINNRKEEANEFFKKSFELGFKLSRNYYNN